ncbi:MAG: hypothetical protein ACJAVS_002370 [Paracoccaceae bacterium]|jgi:hypothetical protein
MPLIAQKAGEAERVAADGAQPERGDRTAGPAGIARVKDRAAGVGKADIDRRVRRDIFLSDDAGIVARKVNAFGRLSPENLRQR